MFLRQWAPQAAIEVVCLLIGMENFSVESMAAFGKRRYLTEKDARAYPAALQDANTVVLIIGDEATSEEIHIAVNVIQKNVVLAECFTILSDKNNSMLGELLKLSAVLEMEKADFDLLLQNTTILDQFLSFVNCDNGWVRLDKADIHSVIDTGHLGKLKLVSACGRNKFSDILKQLQTRFPDHGVSGLILYLVSGIQTDLMEIQKVFSGFADRYSSKTLVMFGVGIEYLPELSDSTTCFMLY